MRELLAPFFVINFKDCVMSSNDKDKSPSTVPPLQVVREGVKQSWSDFQKKGSLPPSPTQTNSTEGPLKALPAPSPVRVVPEHVKSWVGSIVSVDAPYGSTVTPVRLLATQEIGGMALLTVQGYSEQDGKIVGGEVRVVECPPSVRLLFTPNETQPRTCALEVNDEVLMLTLGAVSDPGRAAADYLKVGRADYIGIVQEYCPEFGLVKLQVVRQNSFGPSQDPYSNPDSLGINGWYCRESVALVRRPVKFMEIMTATEDAEVCVQYAWVSEEGGVEELSSRVEGPLYVRFRTIVETTAAVGLVYSLRNARSSRNIRVPESCLSLAVPGLSPLSYSTGRTYQTALVDGKQVGCVLRTRGFHNPESYAYQVMKVARGETSSWQGSASFFPAYVEAGPSDQRVRALASPRGSIVYISSDTYTLYQSPEYGDGWYSSSVTEIQELHGRTGVVRSDDALHRYVEVWIPGIGIKCLPRSVLYSSLQFSTTYGFEQPRMAVDISQLYGAHTGDFVNVLVVGRHGDGAGHVVGTRRHRAYSVDDVWNMHVMAHIEGILGLEGQILTRDDGGNPEEFLENVFYRPYPDRVCGTSEYELFSLTVDRTLPRRPGVDEDDPTEEETILWAVSISIPTAMAVGAEQDGIDLGQILDTVL